jgi:hypothetical protein
MLKPARASKRVRAKRFPGIKLTTQELAEIRSIYGPFLSLHQAASIAGLAPITLKKQVSEGRYHPPWTHRRCDRAIRYRGAPPAPSMPRCSFGRIRRPDSWASLTDLTLDPRHRRLGR